MDKVSDFGAKVFCSNPCGGEQIYLRLINELHIMDDELCMYAI